MSVYIYIHMYTYNIHIFQLPFLSQPFYHVPFQIFLAPYFLRKRFGPCCPRFTFISLFFALFILKEEYEALQGIIFLTFLTRILFGKVCENNYYQIMSKLLEIRTHRHLNKKNQFLFDNFNLFVDYHILCYSLFLNYLLLHQNFF